MQVNPSEDLFCCTKKGNMEEKNSNKKQSKYFNVNVLPSSSLFSVLLAVS